MNLQVGDTLQYRAGYNIFAQASDNIPVSKAANPGLLNLVLIEPVDPNAHGEDSAAQIACSLASVALVLGSLL